ncbi:DUF4406 domain-containing protein [Pseudomonas asplenii]|uniref:DUF4406 domain-containing protein n=1 Tax=Pseudomonas asplenii TaxID=53407 RepID=A0A1H6NYM7_9PSED|nr:DUF4406 domain-containing protein [Pseudomonas fuscovaginae]SEI17012.1 protein of unknown function [Pseudomonas fuscovaginae]
MSEQKHIDCPALHKRFAGYPYGDQVPRTVRMLKDVTADPMPGIGFAYIDGPVPFAKQQDILPAWTNSHGALTAVLPDGRRLGLRPGEFEVDSWHDERAEYRVYLCGPMTGLPDCNYPAFHAEAARLRDLGHHVENPAENPKPVRDKWELYMRMSIPQMLTCDTVATLPGWEQSKGARLEVEIATQLGLRVIRASSLTEEPEAA